MRTEDDIRAALTTLEREAPDARDVLEQLTARTERRRGRPVVLIAVAAATAAAVVAVPTLLSADDDSADPASSGGVRDVRWEHSYTLQAPPGWTILSESIWPRAQATSLRGLKLQQCDVISYAPGAFDTERIAARHERIAVNGHPGFVIDLKVVVANVDKSRRRQPVPGLTDSTRPAVAWEYAPNAWRLSDCGATESYPNKDRARMVALAKLSARAVQDSPRALRVPYRVGYLPDGWEPRSVGDQGEFSHVGEAQPDVTLTVLPSDATDMTDPTRPRKVPAPTQPLATYEHLTIDFVNGVAKPPRGTRTTINGLPAVIWRDAKPGTMFDSPRATGAGITIQGRGWYLSISAVTVDPDFVDELTRVAEGVQPASNPLDKSTWFDGTIAIP